MEFVDTSLVEQIEMKMVRPSQFAIRNYPENNFEDEALVQSIKEHGLLQPILIRPLINGFEIIAGHRRFQACRKLRWRYIQCKICEISNKNAFEIQLTENIQRKTMSPMDEAEAFRKYVTEFGWGGISELAKKICKSEEYVSHRIQLLNLSDDVKKQIIANHVKPSQAIELTTLPLEKQKEMMNQIVDNRLTVKQIRKIKSELVDECEEMERFTRSRSSNSVKIIKKTSLGLKIALARIDSLIDNVRISVEPKQNEEIMVFLMGLRLKIHNLIDETIRFKNTKLDKNVK